MGKLKTNTKKILKGLFKFTSYTFLSLIGILGLVIIALQFPAVQTYLARKATDIVSEKLQFPVSIEKVDIDWFDVIDLQGLKVHDFHNHPMIEVGEVKVDFTVHSLLKAKIAIDDITLSDGAVEVVKYAKDSSINITDFVAAIRRATSTGGKGKAKAFTLDEIYLRNMYFSYNDQRKPVNKEGFDHNHFSFDSIYADVNDLLVVADTFSINVQNLHTKEVQTQLRVHKIDTRFHLDKRQMEFSGLYALIGESKIQNYLRLSYNEINDLSDFIEKINITAKLKDSYISSANLAHFAPEMGNYKDVYKLNGNVKGRVNNFSGQDLILTFGKKSYVQGNIWFNGLPDIHETFMQISFDHCRVEAADLRQYLDKNTNYVLSKFGSIQGEVEFAGVPNDFVAKGEINTNLGRLVSDINLKTSKKDEHQKAYYKGHLKTYNFQLGRLMNQEKLVQNIDMSGEIEGEGFTLEDANFHLKADIYMVGLNNYNYSNITTNAQMSKRKFNGQISVNDTNLVFKADGQVDFTDKTEIFKIKANFEKANLKPLNLSPVEALIKTDVDLDFQGIEIDEIVGKIRFYNTYLVYQGKNEIFFKSLYASSYKNDGNREFIVNSDLAKMYASGNFEFTQLAGDFEMLYNELKLTLQNDQDAIEKYYRNKKKYNKEKYTISFDLQLMDINAILAIYFPGVYLSRDVVIQGDFTSGYTNIFNVNTSFDTLYYGDNQMFNTDIELSASKVADSSKVLGMTYISSGGQKLKSVPETKNLTIDAIWSDDYIEFSSSVQQAGTTNKANLNGTFNFLEDDRRTVSFSNSSLTILDKVWNVSPNNKITFQKKDIEFENLALVNEHQTVSIVGVISDNSSKKAFLNVEGFKLEGLNSILSNKLKGTLNGDIEISDIYHDLDILGTVTVDSMYLDKFFIGNVHGESEWMQDTRQLDIHMDVQRENIEVIHVKGYMKPATETTPEELNLEAHLQEAELALLTPILSGFMSKISGTVTGDFKIFGDIKNIVLKAEGFVNNGKFQIDYLGTTYHFTDKIVLEENLIGFRKLRLYDEDNNLAIINGGIYHDNFRNFIVDVKGQVKNFQMLKTEEKDNELFYGIAKVTGDFEILGAFSNLQIAANARSEKGTKIYIPLSFDQGYEQHSYISFKKADKKDEDTLDLSGIELKLNLEVTPDAYTEIIFDKEAGDIIRGNGEGNIKMEIDTRGDFYMYGNYRIVEGYYNFTLAGLINKEFEIKPNSSISWTGDPYAGILDLTANYNQTVYLTPLYYTDLATYQQLSKDRRNTSKYPVNVLMNVKGDLMSPEITLDIDIPKPPATLATYVTDFLTKVRSNEQEMNRQVFSLLVLGKLSPENSFTGIGGSANNLSELLSNQLSNWLSQVDENLQIDVNLNSLDKDALNTFQLRLSYTMLDGRLRITRDGSFQNVQQSSQANLTNIAGEWTVEYLLSQDGNFRLKLYNRNNYNALLNTLNNNSNTSAGFSIMHTQTFDNLKDLFTKKKKKEEKINLEEVPEEEQEQKDSSHSTSHNFINLLPPQRKEDDQKF